MTEDKATEIDRFEPDWQSECDNCGDVPTVTAVLNGQVGAHTGLCGPCTWGEAKMLDPDEWN